MDSQTLLYAFLLTAFAGLSTGIGGLLSCCTKRTSTKGLSVALGFSAGVMIYISFVEMLPASFEGFNEYFGDGSDWMGVLAFFGGILLIALIDRMLPSFENPHEIHKIEEIKDKEAALKSRRLFRMGIVTAFVIFLHNFPEGLATFVTSINDLKLGIVIAVAIAIHNIPEGIAIAIPIYHSTGNRRKAVWYSFLAGLAEPVGAVVGYLLLSQVLNGALFGITFGAVAGIMVFVSLDQLLPAAREYGEHHLSIYGMIGGMAVMAGSLLLFV